MLSYTLLARLVSLGFTPVAIAGLTAPLILRQQALQTGTRSVFDRNTLFTMTAANTRVALGRSGSANLGSTLKEEAGIAAVAKEQAETIEEGFTAKEMLKHLGGSGVLTTLVATADATAAGFSNLAKMSSLRHSLGLPPLKKAQGDNLVSRSMREIRANGVGASLRYPISFVQASFLLMAKPALDEALKLHTNLNEGWRQSLSVLTISAAFGSLKNPLEIIQKLMLKQAAESGESMSRSLAQSAKQAWSLHQWGVFTKGLPLGVAQSFIVYGCIIGTPKLVNNAFENFNLVDEQSDEEECSQPSLSLPSIKSKP